MGNHHSSTVSNTICPGPEAGPPIVPYIGSMTFQTFSHIFTGACAAFTVLVCGLNILGHGLRFSRPAEQKHIIRIITMIMFFTIISFATTYMSNQKAQYIIILLDLYEAFAFASFFLLLCAWIQRAQAQDSKSNITQVAFRKHAFPKASALVFQFPAVMIVLTVVVEITVATGTFCITSHSIHFAHIWVVIIQSISTAIAFLTVLGVYRNSKVGIHQHKPTLKFFSFKSIIAVRFVQTLIFSFLTSRNDIAPSSHLSYNDISVGIPAMILTAEMALYSLLFLYAFRSSAYVIGVEARQYEQYTGEYPQQPQPDQFQYQQEQYRQQPAANFSPSDAARARELGFPTSYHGGFMGIKAYLAALDIRDLVGGILAVPAALLARRA